MRASDFDYVTQHGWIGFDLDGTVAKYDGWIGPQHIGEPIPAMIELIRYYISKGYECRIMTARICDGLDSTRLAIEDWTERYVGKRLRATNEKDYEMILLYDDRAIQVELNTGKILGKDPYNL